jgi:hypothetical protein
MKYGGNQENLPVINYAGIPAGLKIISPLCYHYSQKQQSSQFLTAFLTMREALWGI